MLSPQGFTVVQIQECMLVKGHPGECDARLEDSVFSEEAALVTLDKVLLKNGVNPVRPGEEQS